jgi:hypothetical protein
MWGIRAEMKFGISDKTVMFLNAEIATSGQWQCESECWWQTSFAERSRGMQHEFPALCNAWVGAGMLVMQ